MRTRYATLPLDCDARDAADDSVHALMTGEEQPIRSLTMRPEDARYRRHWMNAYIAAGGQYSRRRPPRRAGSATVECIHRPTGVAILVVRVVGAEDNNPLENAIIWIEDESGSAIERVTAFDGTITLENFTPGEYTIEVRAEGRYRFGLEQMVPAETTISVEIKLEVTRAEWQRRALRAAGIDIGQWRPGRGFVRNRPIVERVYSYYTQLFNRDENLKWAGMAKLAGGEVLRGLLEAQGRIDVARTTPVIVVPGAPGAGGTGLGLNIQAGYAGRLQNRFLEMQKAIFIDLAWQHQAYVEGELHAMETAHSQGETVPIEAWRDIDSGDPSRIWRGNRTLLRREQARILPAHYDAIRDMRDFDFIPSMMSEQALSPIPDVDGGRPFQAVVPNGDITILDDRWDWINTNMLPAYQRLSTERRRRLVNTSLLTLSRRRFPP